MLADLQHTAGFFDRDACSLGHFFVSGLAAFFLEQLLRDVAKLRHRLDHVHWNTDGAGLVSDSTSDGLANPPGGIRRELIAPTILVLINGTHQAGVAFLNEIEEGEATVAVLLGDADDEAKVASGKFPLGSFVLFVAAFHHTGAELEIFGRLERPKHQVLHLQFERGNLVFATSLFTQDGHLAGQVVHACRDLLQLLHQRLHSLGADGEFFTQRDALATAETQPTANLAEFLLGDARIETLVEVFEVSLHQVFERLQVVRHTVENLVFLQVLSHRHLHGAVEGKFAAVYSLQRFDDAGESIVAFEDFAAEAVAGDFNALGEVDFLVAGEQRDFAHLRQIHAYRIVYASATVAIVEERAEDFVAQLLAVGAGISSGGVGFTFFGIALINEFNAVLFEEHHQLVKLVGVDIIGRKHLIDLSISQEALLLTLFDEGFQAFVHLFHPTSPRRGHCRGERQSWVGTRDSGSGIIQVSSKKGSPFL